MKTYTWTNKIITEHGWYWAKLVFPNRNTYVTIVRVTQGNISRGKLTIRYGEYFVYPYTFVEDEHCEFSEKLVPPGED